MSSQAPEWFLVGEKVHAQVMSRIAASVRDLRMAPQVRSAPMMAHWFMMDSMLLANRANREGMHANALALTRQCLEAISVVELGVCRHREAEATLVKWDNDRLSPGKLRAWLEINVWPQYGAGIWTEDWNVFTREFSAALQPYAHYGRDLAQWQFKLHNDGTASMADGSSSLLLEIRPRAYDPQKATRITLFHAILVFMLGRIWLSANSTDKTFAESINQLRVALGKSKYLDGRQTNWSQQFWATLWNRSGGTVLE